MIKTTRTMIYKIFSGINTKWTRQILSASIWIAITVNAVFGVTKTSVSSGNWNTESCWSPTGTPSPNDDVVIGENTTITLNSARQVNHLTVSASGTFLFNPGQSLTLTGNMTVNGSLDMNGGNINFTTHGKDFTLGPASTFTWNPGNNTQSGATLFTKCIEHFHSTSTLVIRKWYNYLIPLGDVVTGNFGNLNINTNDGGNFIMEWNQNNKFETHLISGTLTVDQGWVTLDKSGTISTTTIGNIVLTSVNSTFIAHNGNHPSQFTINTASISNFGGNFFGLNDGNGNIALNVFGNFQNNGNVKIINNTGITGVSNGNATFNVNGDFIQNKGDTRIIYNVTTVNSGNFTASFRNLFLNGGIFMGQSACHTAGGTNTMTIQQDLKVNFQKSSDKFRGNGLTSIGQSVNNARLSFQVGRHVEIKGNANAEFTSSASSGTEIINITGDLTLNGCNTNFNFGTEGNSHNTQILISGNVFVKNGSCTFSKNVGQVDCFIGKNVKLTNGVLNIKGNSGIATCRINGSYNQTGGLLNFHSNTSQPTPDVVRIEVKGNFNLEGGIIKYDNYAIGAQHVLSLQGDSCIIKGSATITRAGNGISDFFGFLNFEKQGRIVYQRKGNPVLEQVIQTIHNNCELFVNNCNLEIATHRARLFQTLSIFPGGKLSLQKAAIVSNAQHNFCSMHVDSSGTLSFDNDKGLFGKNGAAIDEEINYSLHKSSIVEYSGAKVQDITGFQEESIPVDKQYGILRINTGKGNARVKLTDDVTVRTRLELEKGCLQLNNHILTLENGSPHALSRTSGYIDSDWDSKSSTSAFIWKNITAGDHEIPFGRTSTVYVPVHINPLTGIGNTLNIYSHRFDAEETDDSNNGNNSANYSMIPDPVKRCWNISGDGIIADVSLSFSKDENASYADWVYANYQVLKWSGTEWQTVNSSSQQRTANYRTISLNGFQSWADLIVSADPNGIQQNSKVPESSKESEIIKNRQKNINGTAGFSVPVQVYPNPFSEKINIEYTSDSPINIDVADATGRLVYSAREKSSDKHKNTIQFDLYYLKKGIYFITLTANGKKETTQIIKEE